MILNNILQNRCLAIDLIIEIHILYNHVWYVLTKFILTMYFNSLQVRYINYLFNTTWLIIIINNELLTSILNNYKIILS